MTQIKIHLKRQILMTWEKLLQQISFALDLLRKYKIFCAEIWLQEWCTHKISSLLFYMRFLQSSKYFWIEV